MSEVKTYAVNCNDAWLNTDGDDISGSYVKYADYIALATKLDLAERACAAVVAENAAFKDINAWCKTDAFSNMYREFKTAEAVGCCNADCMHDAMVVAIMHAPEAPATDAFLAEVRAQGVEMLYASRAAQWDDELLSELNEFSTQLREGGAA